MLRISEVARRVGISSSALRACEMAGLVAPQQAHVGFGVLAIAAYGALRRH